MRQIYRFPVFFILSFFLLGFVHSAQSNEESSDAKWVACMNQIESTIMEARFTDALNLLSEAKKTHPNEDFGINYYMAIVLGFLGKQEEGLSLIRQGHEKGYFFNISTTYRSFRSYAQTDTIEEVLQVDNQLKDKFNESSEFQFKVALPKDFDAEKAYPVLFIFHGGGCNIRIEETRLNIPSLKRDWIRVYLQSAHYITSDACVWKNDDKTRKSLRDAFRKLSHKFRFAQGRVYTAGMSNGGMMALRTCLEDVFETDGAILNCPVIPDDLANPNLLLRAKKQNKRVVIITGSKDWSLEKQKHLKEKMDEFGLKTHMEIVEGMGHDTPKDLPERFDRAVEFFNGGKEPRNSSVDVTYIGNEGFLFEASGYKVLIDGSNTSDQGMYQTLPLAYREKMASAEAPFNAIDLLLITHAHRDHFDPTLNVRHLLANPRTKLIISSQVIEELAKQDGFEQVKDRVIEVTAARGEGQTLALDGIDLDIANLNHVPNQKWEPGYRSELDNLAFLIHLGKMRLIHTGDTVFAIEQQTLESLGWPWKEVDLVFMEYFDRSDYSRDFVQQRMQPGFIVPMHIPPETFEQDSGNFLSVYDDATLFPKPFVKRTFFKDGTKMLWNSDVIDPEVSLRASEQVYFVSNDGKPLLFSSVGPTAGEGNTFIPTGYLYNE